MTRIIKLLLLVFQLLLLETPFQLVGLVFSILIDQDFTANNIIWKKLSIIFIFLQFFLSFEFEFLGMRSNIWLISCLNMCLDFVPLGTIQFQSLYKKCVLLIRPPAYLVCRLVLTLISKRGLISTGIVILALCIILILLFLHVILLIIEILLF